MDMYLGRECVKLHCLSPLRITSLITSNLSSHGFHRSRARENDWAAAAVVVDVVDVVVIVVVDDNDDDDVVVAVVMVVRYAIQVFLARAIVGAQSPGSAGNVWPTPARLRGR